MFRFWKKGKIELSKKINKLSIDASEQFLNYLKEDTLIYDKCINDNPIKNTSVLFMINIYRDILNSKYNGQDVFAVIYTSVTSLASDKKMEELCMNTFMEYMKSCNESIEFCKKLLDFDLIDVLTKVFFRLVIEDSEYFQNELVEMITKSISYKKIYNYIDGVMKNSIILNEEYNLRLK